MRMAADRMLLTRAASAKVCSTPPIVKRFVHWTGK
jgi:hypothetical protein